MGFHRKTPVGGGRCPERKTCMGRGPFDFKMGRGCRKNIWEGQQANKNVEGGRQKCPFLCVII